MTKQKPPISGKKSQRREQRITAARKRGPKKGAVDEFEGPVRDKPKWCLAHDGEIPPGVPFMTFDITKSRAGQVDAQHTMTICGKCAGHITKSFLDMLKQYPELAPLAGIVSLSRGADGRWHLGRRGSNPDALSRDLAAR